MSLDTSLLDFKLGLRMLIKHPVLTLVGVLATTFAIAMSAAYFEIVGDYVNPSLPLENGERMVAIQNLDPRSASVERRSLHDFDIWRTELTSVDELTAYAINARNLRPDGSSAEPVSVVAIGAAAFRIARIPPLLGRTLLDADEQNDAPPVVVIGERLWEARFARDPNIIGRSVQLGSERPTIVGVMPRSFALPVNQGIWIPFRMAARPPARGEGPAVGVFGILAPGATRETAQTELTVLGERIAAASPATDVRLRPVVIPYLEPFTGGIGERSLRFGVNVIFMMLLALICANVGAMVFARTATRERELVVRTALGASRTRIIMQLFIEALVLAGVGAVIALAVLGIGMQKGEAFFWGLQNEVPPFWVNSGLNLSTLLYIAVLTVLSAVISGVVPALRFTGGGIQTRLQRSAVGGSGMRSRRMSTRVIVAQVALSGALLPLALSTTMKLNWFGRPPLGVRASEFLSIAYAIEQPAGVPTEQAAAWTSARFDTTYRALKARLLGDEAFAAVTFADLLPGAIRAGRMVEVEGGAIGGSSGGAKRARPASVDVEFFDAFGVAMVEGRAFRPGDLEPGQRVVIVNEPFVRSMLGGRSAVGRRVRYAAFQGEQAGPWYEIVGVAPDLGTNPADPKHSEGLYHPLAPGSARSGFMAVRVRENPAGIAQRFRSIAETVDPSLLIHETRPLHEIRNAELQMDRAFALASIAAIYFIVLLSAAVTFALMSFTVAQRTREIGIRKALGAGRRAIITAVFSRAFTQLVLGAGLGALTSLVVFSNLPGTSAPEPALVFLVVGFMLLVGIASCGAPALHALRIAPTEAMRDDL